jgi:hypothetical protein
VVDTSGEGTSESTWLHKGQLLRWAFDLAFTDPATRQALYAEALALLDSEGALDQLTADWSADTAGEFTSEQKAHFRDHWLVSNAFIGGEDTEEYLRLGFREAIQHAKDRDVELNAIWVEAGTEGDVSLGYVDNPSSVTLVLLTPHAAAKNVDPGEEYSDPWANVISHQPVV